MYEVKPIIGKSFAETVIPLIDDARSSIDIIVFDWRWYHNIVAHPVQRFNQAIARAVRRCVDVRAVVNNPDIIPKLREIGVEAKKLLTARRVHCKMMLIDSRIVVTGSHNYTQSAFQTNHELSVVLTSTDDVIEFARFFESMWNNYAESNFR